MPEFTFSMIHNGIEHKEQIEIPEEELKHGSPLFPPGHSFHDIYRRNVIQRRLNAWAISHLNLSWEEVKEDESHADHTDHSAAESKA